MMKRKNMTVFLCLLLVTYLLINPLNINQSYTSDVQAATSQSSRFPRKYDLREENRLTPVKEQGGIGSCWALASTAALESTLMTLEGAEYDFSENNMIVQTSEYYSTGYDRLPEHGGDDAMATAYFASWSGPVLEEDDPYPESLRYEDIEVRPGMTPVRHVQEVLFVPKRDNALDNEFIKEMVIKYGAVSTAMWKGSEQTFGPYYSEENFAWYYPYQYMNNEGNGHAVNIVGWDDDYPKENFKMQPQGDGAFIVRNTKGPEWGQYDRKENMGGYFYISYYDGMLGDKLDSNIGSAVITRVDDIDNYDYIYQYDWLGYTKTLQPKVYNKEASFANVFEIGQGESEQLEAVSFYTLDEDLDYEIWIVKDYYSTASFNNIELIQSGKIKYTGYHTIDLDKAVSIESSRKIAVIVKLSSSKVKPQIAIESPKGLNSSQAKANKKESYVIQDVNIGWEDLYDYEKGANVCLKIFTSDDQSKIEKLTPEDMKTDVDYIIERLKTFQPDVQLQGFTEQQQQVIDSVYEAIKVPKTKMDFYFLAKQLYTMMHDGHTKLFYYPNKGVMYLNLPISWLNEGIVVNQTFDGLTIGDRIYSLSGKTPDELENMLYKVVSAENKYWIHAKSQDVLNKSYYLKELELTNNNGTVDIELRKEDQPYILKRELMGNLYIEQQFNKEWFSWQIEEENNLGYFRFDSFASGDELEILIDNLDAFFAEVKQKGIDNIVFDLRNNPGGTAGALNHILKYLETGKVYSEDNSEYNVYGSKVPDEMLFRGNSYVMISNNSYSCTVLATTILKDNDISKVIGEPSGEKPAFNRHGNSADGELPITDWHFMMTFYKPTRPYGNDVTEDSIYPDIPVHTTSEDIMAGRDIQVERMREYVNPNIYNVYTEETLLIEKEEQWLIKEGKAFNIDKENKTIFVKAPVLDVDIYLTDTKEHNKTHIEVYKTENGFTFSIPDDLDENKTYHLNIRWSRETYMTLLNIGKKVVKPKTGFYYRDDYGSTYTKFGYLLLHFTEQPKDNIDKKKIKLTDEDDKIIPIKNVMCPSGGPKSVLISLHYKLTSNNTYTLQIEKGTFESVDGEVIDEAIEITFIPQY